MMKASDIIKAKDMLCKITGAYAPEISRGRKHYL